MVVPYDEAMERFKDYIETAKSAKQKIENLGYVVEVENDIGLGAVYKIYSGENNVGIIEWNVPHYLSFTNLGELNLESFDLDYIKNVGDFKSFMNDIVLSIQDNAHDGSHHKLI